ncbi:hypothetical protein [Patiriisocius marinus]|uniref:Uncharacterized protein n=1 Tax=Patiriisocius marinus TaxID=1397112 RepID=A0A5J4IMP4_9FLAO|nr:hypothetical protein [Patiriisocius marinus]GER58539.1 hypothetical protein ULMA_06470 [Patiriisocius marinus]
MNWCILIPLLVGLICALLGYLLGKLLSGGSDNRDSASLNKWRDKNAQLEADLAACKSKLSASMATKDASSTGSSTVKTASSFAGGAAASAVVVSESAPKEVSLPFDAAAAKLAFGKKIKQDDLKVVEGIGPKISELFMNDGITTWKMLGEASVSRLKGILDAQGERYKVHNPATWPMQSKMAYEGKWAELKKWQDEHDYGKN